MLRIEPRVFLYGALLLMLLPASWVLAAVAAAVFHELCHLAVIWLLGGTVTEVRVDVGAAKIKVHLPDTRRELLAALAGPAGSFLLVGMCNLAPKIAICALLQGIYNLLPIYPLDGGRAMKCLLELIWPERSDTILNGVEVGTAVLLLLLAVWSSYRHCLGIWPFLAALLPVSKVIARKIPCKRKRIRVQ